MKHLPLLLFIHCFSCLCAQNGAPPTAGARSAAMGYTGATYTDINSIFSNQAGLAHLETPAITGYGEQRFLISEIRAAALGAALPTSSGTFGLSLHYFGFEKYNEQRVGLAYGRRLLDKLSLGAQFLVLNTRIPEYGNKAALTFELGAMAELLPQLNLGVHLFSPARVRLTDEENLPSILNLGISYLPSRKLALFAELEKDIDFSARAKFGLEYQIIEAFFLRLGTATQPTLLSFGLGYSLPNGLAIDIASSYHQVLGFTPTASITFKQ
ncbi:MAG: hypothetical protein H6560_14805 [Lewinellaceae bacterium]|nr:hypothetical protein [Lewinellaceae bacterium]